MVSQLQLQTLYMYNDKLCSLFKLWTLECQTKTENEYMTCIMSYERLKYIYVVYLFLVIITHILACIHTSLRKNNRDFLKNSFIDFLVE